MEKIETTTSQDIFVTVTKIIETECYSDATELLKEGFVLLGVANNIYEDDGNRFIYSLGFLRPLDELSDWVKSNF